MAEAFVGWKFEATVPVIRVCQAALVDGLELEASTNVAQKGKFKRSFLIIPGVELSIGRSQ